MKNKFAFFATLAVLILFGFSAQAQAQEKTNVVNPPNCRVIRVVSYPVAQRADKNVKKRIALLNLCPENRGMVARPLLAVGVGGKFEMFEYDVVRVFKNRKEAEKYAQKNDIKDATF
ncbi:MAG TPA: hypothetical protein VF604_06875 [Pyrinomonadaceae bacterium]|jgi:hypothetical protein